VRLQGCEAQSLCLSFMSKRDTTANYGTVRRSKSHVRDIVCVRSDAAFVSSKGDETRVSPHLCCINPVACDSSFSSEMIWKNNSPDSRLRLYRSMEEFA
jgi:hypothetical protein